jgi:glycosyltransferase involved in cell wall biosynthesis
MKQLSIIVPAYNAEKYIEKCIESCENQDVSHGEYEIIIVNDGSTDGTLTIVNKLAEKYDNIKFFTQENQGTASARNTGKYKASGQYVWFIDADDYIEIDSLKSILKEISKNQFPDIYAVKMKVIHNDYVGIGGHNMPADIIMSGRDAILHDFSPGSVCCFIICSSFLKQRSFLFKTNVFLEDCEFSLRCIALAGRVYFSNSVVYVYESHPNTKTTDVSAEGFYKKLWGNIPLVLSWKEFVNTIEDKELKDKIIRRSNSTLAGVLVMLKREKNPNITKQFKKNFLDKMKANGCYPVNGPFLSWKMSLYIKLLNIKRFIV